jgi:hypothetical protein
MKKMAFSALLILFLPAVVFAQDKVEAPVWNVGDKWVFTGGALIEVIKADQKMYILNFSKNICPQESAGFDKIAFEKSNLNRSHTLDGDKLKKYSSYLKKRFNFPYYPGKEWKDTCSAKAYTGPMSGATLDFSETFKVLGWENVEVKAGKFRALKLSYSQEITGPPSPIMGYVGVAMYWYSPEVKYFVKCEYEPFYFLGLPNWELTSFQLKK